MNKVAALLKDMLSKEILFVILLLSFVLRLISINQSLWLDEAIGALVVRGQSYYEILTQFPLADNHPPLYYLTLKGWTDIFGYSEFALRSLSVTFGVLTVYFVYKIGSLLFKKEKLAPLAATLLLATSPLHIYYSQEARMYVMAGFLATAGIYYFLKTFRKNAKLIDWVLFSFFYTALIFTDYVPVFLYPTFFIYPILKKKGISWWRSFFAANLPLIALGFFWKPIFMAQLEKGGQLLSILPEWQRLAGGASVKELALFWMKFVLGRISFFNKILYYGLVIVASIPVAIAFLKGLFSKKPKTVLILWFLLTPALGFVFSFIFPAFKYFRFVFLLPAFYLLITHGLRKTFFPLNYILFSLIIFFNLVGWGIYVLDDNQKRENWRQATNFVEENAKRDEAALFVYPEPFAPYRWYEEGRVDAAGVTESISASEGASKALTREFLEDKVGVYYFNYLVDLTDPNSYVLSEIKELGFEEEKSYAFQGVGEITHFVKN